MLTHVCIRHIKLAIWLAVAVYFMHIFVAAASAAAEGSGLQQSDQGTLVPWSAGRGLNILSTLHANLWSEPPNLDGTLVSSEVIGAYGLQSEVANDFVLPAGTQIARARWWGGYYSCASYPDCQPHVGGFTLRFFLDSGCRPDSSIAEFILPDAAHEQMVHVQQNGRPIYEYWADVNFTIPHDGRCWFEVQTADHAYPPQWGRLAAGQVTQCESVFRSAFFGYPGWTPVSQIVGQSYDASQQFEAGQEAETVIRNFTPPGWQGDDVRWVRDKDPHNRVDDLIDMSTDSTFDIIVNFDRCPAPAEVDELNQMTNGGVSFVSKYITTACVDGVRKSLIYDLIGALPIAFIEWQLGFQPSLNVSVPTIKVAASGTYSPNTVADCAPGIDGSGVNIAIIDTGVDNTQHGAFAATPFIGGYNALTDTFEDPDDDVGHGTHVASIALGQRINNTAPGVAPGAGLIDVKVIGPTSFCNTPGVWQSVARGLETVYDVRTAWNVKVINMSLGQCNSDGGVASDGLDAFSQLCDLAESMGIVVVAAAGNSGPNNAFLSTPAAATRAITVAASDDMNTITRTDDGIAGFSSKGPRSTDGDADCMDELKPEIAAPGRGIIAAKYNTVDQSVSKDGTSMAAPHVAGLAALIIEKNPSINPASVKDVIIRSAESRGPASAPSCDPAWNDRWGWGLVDGWASVCGTAAVTDLTFPNCPSHPGWLSPDLTTAPFPPRVNQSCVITAMIENAGPVPAFGARIDFGVHVFSAATPTFYHLGSRIVNLPVGVTPVTLNWTPLNASHQCLKVEIAYAPDADYSCNTAKRNLAVSDNPVSFAIQNTASEDPLEVYFVGTLEAEPGAVWDWTIEPASLMLSADDCSRQISADLIPVDVPEGSTATLHVSARVDGPTGFQEIGGISFMDTAEGPGSVDGEDGEKGFSLRIEGTQPIRSRARIRYQIPVAGQVQIGLYDVSGRLLATLVDQREIAGSHVVEWSDADAPHSHLTSGVYFVRMKAGGMGLSRPLVILR